MADSGHTATLLSALAYPDPPPDLQSFNQGYRKLVIWLENQKIRQLAQADRSRLADTQSQDWVSALSQYADELGSPVTAVESTSKAFMTWLLHLAVSLPYQDQGHTAGQQRQDGQHGCSLSGVKGERASQHIQDIGLRLQLSGSADGKQTLQALVERVQMLQKSSSSKCDFSMDNVPLGFSTQDAHVDRAACVLRLLYLKQLRQLQTAIDDAIVGVQEYTANPRTNTR